VNDQILRIDDAVAFNSLQQSKFIDKCVILDNSKFRIDAGSWLESISMGDFFLCPPGYVMPMCHNVIEAMAVGAIPVINYPEWLNPSLEDGVNCVAFTDADDLVEKIDHVLAMKQAEISEMKSRVIEYYEQHLDPKEFVSKLVSIDGENILLLMITDGCVAKSPTKLNKSSILITGSARHPGNIWKGIRKAFGI
jgi:glycosyltransferase involved in cell wall biosynthesis